MAALTLNNLIQCTDSESPDQSSATMRDQHETLMFDVQNSTGAPIQLTEDGLNSLESLILGTVKDDTESTGLGTRAIGGLSRRLPMSHPIRKGFYASGRPSLQGTGGKDIVANQVPVALLPQLNPNAPSVSILYPNYRLSVDFTPRLYNVWPDSYISSYSGGWYNFDSVASGFIYVDEWMRHTEVDYHPKDDWISYTLGGQMAFKAKVGSDPSGVNGAQYAQMPRIRMPNSTLKITWYQVPYRYVTSPNSYLEKYKGRINQNGWWRWQPGALLFINYNPIRYQQPNPNSVGAYSINPSSVAGGPLNPNPSPTKYPNDSWAQTCDIEMDFILTRRYLQTGEIAIGSKGNSVVGGHNLLPWGQDRNFHYAETLDPAGLGRNYPFWLSAPFEILFSDPDYVQAGV